MRSAFPPYVDCAGSKTSIYSYKETPELNSHTRKIVDKLIIADRDMINKIDTLILIVILMTNSDLFSERKNKPLSAEESDRKENNI